MVTRVGTEDNAIEMLEHLIALDYDAVEAYQAAIERLDNKDYQASLAAFKADHQRHVRELSPVVQQLGGTPPTGPDSSKGLMAQGKVAMADLIGDKAILEAMRTNEDDTNTAYQRAMEKAPAEVLDIVTRGREDERRHCEWILTTLKAI
jgi:uncharacterized protein (TIGR02284 family)